MSSSTKKPDLDELKKDHSDVRDVRCFEEIETQNASSFDQKIATLPKGAQNTNTSSEEADSKPFTLHDENQVPRAIPTSISKSLQVQKLPKDHYYKIHGKSKAFIFNHEFFERLPTRTGTNADCTNMEKVLQSLGFKVKTFKDLKYLPLMHEITLAAKKDYSKYDCVAVVMLTHGENNHLFTSDTMYRAHLLWKQFAVNESLKKKPKLFFVQACQGMEMDYGIEMRIQLDSSEFGNYEFFTMPDFLIVYSTVPSYVSWRNKEAGAWFIQALVEELGLYGKERDLLTLLTFVNNKLSIDFPRNVNNQHKQVMRVDSTLTRLLVFHKNESCTVL